MCRGAEGKEPSGGSHSSLSTLHIVCTSFFWMGHDFSEDVHDYREEPDDVCGRTTCSVSFQAKAPAARSTTAPPCDLADDDSAWPTCWMTDKKSWIGASCYVALNGHCPILNPYQSRRRSVGRRRRLWTVPPELQRCLNQQLMKFRTHFNWAGEVCKRCLFRCHFNFPVRWKEPNNLFPLML